MKFSNALTGQKKSFIIAFSFLTLGFWACDAEPETSQDYYNTTAENMNYPVNENSDYNANAGNYQGQPGGAPATDGYKKVQIYDKGLQMLISTVSIPADWQLAQDIAYDPNTGRPIRHQLEMTCPHGGLSRGFAHMFKFGYNTGNSFDQAYRQAIQTALQGTLQNPSVGQMEPDHETASLPRYQKMAQRLAAQGQQVNPYKVALTGQRNGQSFKGEIGISIFRQATAMGEFGIVQLSGIGIAPSEHYDEVKAIGKRITQTTAYNPAYEQRMEQINQRVSQQMAIANQQRSQQAAAAHQQRMARNQAAYNAHQQRMGQMSQMQDQSFNSYMNGLRNSGSYNSGTGYSSQDAFIDQIHERSTFNDPWSGQEQHMDGQYDYNYTNGLGDYYRTNDPSFDPNSLQGNWQQIEPESPY